MPLFGHKDLPLMTFFDCWSLNNSFFQISRKVSTQADWTEQFIIHKKAKSAKQFRVKLKG